MVRAWGTVMAVLLVTGLAGADWNEGTAAFQRGDFEAAAEHFELIVADHPDWAGGYLMLGRCQLALGQSGDAVTSLRKAARLGPDDPANTVALSQALLAEHDYDGANDVLGALDRTALPEAWRSEVAILEARALGGRGATGEAVAALEARLGADDDDPGLHRALAAACRANGDRRAALVHLARAMELDPGGVELGRRQVVTALSIAGEAPDDEDRVSLYGIVQGMAVSLAEGFPQAEVAVLAGEAALGAGDLTAAVQWFGSAGDDAFARYNLGRALAALDRDDEAVVSLESAVAGSPDPAIARAAHAQLARLKACDLRFEEAAGHYRAAGNERGAAELTRVAASYGEAAGLLDALRSKLVDLAAMAGELRQLGDEDGVAAVQQRRQILEEELGAIELNLDEVRVALCD